MGYSMADAVSAVGGSVAVASFGSVAAPGTVPSGGQGGAGGTLVSEVLRENERRQRSGQAPAGTSLQGNGSSTPFLAQLLGQGAALPRDLSEEEERRLRDALEQAIRERRQAQEAHRAEEARGRLLSQQALAQVAAERATAQDRAQDSYREARHLDRGGRGNALALPSGAYQTLIPVVRSVDIVV